MHWHPGSLRARFALSLRRMEEFWILTVAKGGFELTCLQETGLLHQSLLGCGAKALPRIFSLRTVQAFGGRSKIEWSRILNENLEIRGQLLFSSHIATHVDDAVEAVPITTSLQAGLTRAAPGVSRYPTIRALRATDT